MKQLFKASKDSVVLIISFDHNFKALGYGSGFFVGEGNNIITNYHVIENGKYFAIKLNGGKIGKINSILGYDEENDLALLESSYKGKPLPLAKGKAEVGDDIIAIGNPQGLEGTLSKGLVSGIREDSQAYYYQITAPISPGSSGGPIINQYGEVIGVSTAFLKEGQNLNFAVPSVYVSDLLMRPVPYSIIPKPTEFESFEDDGEGISLDTKDSRYASYFARIKRQIELVWDYPEEAESKEIIGQLTLRFQISRDGTLMNVRVINGSGHSILDEAALQAVKSAEPFYPFPDTIDRETLPILAKFVYSPRSGQEVKDHDEKPNQNNIIDKASPRESETVIVDALSLYLGLVKSKIDQHWKDPLGGGTGSVNVSFTIFPRGNIATPKIVKSSGVSKLDSLAIRAIKNAVPLPPFPKEFKEPNLPVTFEFWH